MVSKGSSGMEVILSSLEVLDRWKQESEMLSLTLFAKLDLNNELFIIQ